jgi:short-subunit dehydrogenase
VITGASRGIGRALALEYAAVGCRVALAARNERDLERVAKECREAGGRALPVVTDVGSREQVQATIERTLEEWGQLDILVNNAGFGVRAFLEELPEEDLQQILRINLFGVLYAVQAALPQMKRQGRGQIINIGSVIGRRSLPTVGAYCLSKSAVAAFSESLRAEVERYGIRVLQAEPSQTRTPFLEYQKVVGDHPAYGLRPTALSPERCARKIVRAARRGKDRISMGLEAQVLIRLNQVWHGLVNRLMERYMRRKYPLASGEKP